MEELEQLAKLIEGGKSKRILVLCGAGVSTGTIDRTAKPLT
jgi:NAD-dependent SIR2 family protein deacetylase